MTDLQQTVVAALAGRRFPLENEKATQAAIEEVLVAKFGVCVFREACVAGGIIDFVVVERIDGLAVVPGVGIEVKLKGRPGAIRRQVKGYADEPSIAALVLATARPIAMPVSIGGKPVAVLDLGRAWL